MNYTDVILGHNDYKGARSNYKTRDGRYPNRDLAYWNYEWMKQTEPQYRAAWLHARSKDTIKYLNTEFFAPWIEEMSKYEPPAEADAQKQLLKEIEASRLAFNKKMKDEKREKLEIKKQIYEEVQKRLEDKAKEKAKKESKSKCVVS